MTTDAPRPGRQPLLGAAHIQAVLDWYRDNGRDLPWRAPERTPWGVLVCEVMSQQTPVARIITPWREWLARWPTPGDLAAASPGEAIRMWGRLGYPRRALRLHAAATAMVERHDGQVPGTVAELLALPGVGGYTAAATAAFGFGVPTTVLDVNIRRVLDRVAGGPAGRDPAHGAPPPGSPTRAETERAGAVLPADPATAAAWNAAVMELGALVCVARAPRCPTCPLLSTCWTAAAGRGAAPAGAGSGGPRQPWLGTDRHVRGLVMARLRDSEHAVVRADLDLVWPEQAQLGRCIAALIADGLAVATPGRLGLPDATASGPA